MGVGALYLALSCNKDKTNAGKTTPIRWGELLAGISGMGVCLSTTMRLAGSTSKYIKPLGLVSAITFALTSLADAYQKTNGQIDDHNVKSAALKSLSVLLMLAMSVKK